ncbi:MAG: DUF1015 domain-containing protein [Thermodesulfobacteriota bacterium]
MAIIAPFRGIVYNQEKAGDISRLVAPPCGAVSPEEISRFHECHLCNAMNLDFRDQAPGDTSPYDWQVRAARDFQDWLDRGVLIRHEEPAVYLLETDFLSPDTGESLTRLGFLCLLRLEELGKTSKIKPHERTFSTFRAERVNHLKNLQVHLSPIMGVFPDEENRARGILDPVRGSAPLFDFTDMTGLTHRLWPVWDRPTIKDLHNLLEDKTVYIADGHHRYDSALEYRRLIAQGGLVPGPRSPLNYLTFYLCAATDPGLSILPFHRLIKRGLGLSREELEAALARFFEVRVFPFRRGEEEKVRPAFFAGLHQEKGRRTALGLYTRLNDAYYLLTRKGGNLGVCALDQWPAPLRDLDTVVLTGCIFQEILGMTEQDLDDPGQISYSNRAEAALDRVRKGQADMAVLHNPTRMEQVQAVAEAGLTMPRKSTYFYPKVAIGLVFNPVVLTEEVENIG